MSDWGTDDYEPTIEAQPVDVDDAPAPGGRTTAEPPEVVEARATLEDALTEHARATTHLDDARDALADAEGALRVAEAKAKATNYSGDETKATWQRVAAAEDVEKARRVLARRTAAVSTRQRELEDAAAAVHHADQNLADASDHARPIAVEQADHEDGAPTLYYGSVDEFVREYLRHAYRRHIAGRGEHRVWAAEWWKYDEAVIRLEALWRAWEHLRQDPATGMSVWWRDHADHHMAVLLDPQNGPFGPLDGEQDRNVPGAPLPYAVPPEGMFPDVR
ncbi:DUF4913 domain-containing protein [Cellulosimicrobium cellulans]|uniref:DUF4913 domain-containing protein n=1 Tax=Cellulosimicrobium cellulans TaxID=1710 RepID=UPI002405BB74|nr:DUF4913 domain-containing protein [Cellulosimicrobium cellulans]MDF9878465.1 fructose-specific component phosphotransferase system IIB-like protein [Cellulosimicrobium cellulans]